MYFKSSSIWYDFPEPTLYTNSFVSSSNNFLYTFTTSLTSDKSLNAVKFPTYIFPDFPDFSISATCLQKLGIAKVSN